MKRRICQTIVTPVIIPFIIICLLVAGFFYLVALLVACVVWTLESAQQNNLSFQEAFTGTAPCDAVFYSVGSECATTGVECFHDIYLR